MVDQLVQRGTSFKREPITISDLHVNAEVHGWLFAVDVQNRTAKNGRPFRQLKLRDQKGNVIAARQFDLPRIETLMPQKGKVVLNASKLTMRHVLVTAVDRKIEPFLPFLPSVRAL